MWDIIIIGGGPAGVSAGLTALNRGKSVLVIANGAESADISRAGLVKNYPGLPDIGGGELMEIFRAQLASAGAEVLTARVLSAMSMGDSFYVSTGAEDFQCGALILTTGIVKGQIFPGEIEFLGKGVSYCATCDGMLYRGKSVAVVGLNSYAPEEAEFLRSIGCRVEYFDRKRARKYEIEGEETVTALVADGTRYPEDGIFILRSTIAPDSLLPGLELREGHISVGDGMETSVKGVFAAGDCVGRPYQIARAVGQGNTAAISAAEYLDKR